MIIAIEDMDVFAQKEHRNDFQYGTKKYSYGEPQSYYFTEDPEGLLEDKKVFL